MEPPSQSYIRAMEIMEFKDRKISALEAESVASNLSIQKLVDEKSSLAFENGELKFRVASLVRKTSTVVMQL